ncbi:hypothetical protein TNCV_4714331 [Trichonephila clavipes]|nr:hypothetical protein TNCV_4714331 [Trichonephila clavipes]
MYWWNPPAHQRYVVKSHGLSLQSRDPGLFKWRRALEAVTCMVQNVKLGGHQRYLSINRLWHELCDMLRRLLEPQLLDIMIVQFRNEKIVIMALYRSPLTVTLWSSSFLKKYGPMIPPAHKAHQTVSFSGCNGVSTYTCGLASLKCGSFVC